MPDTLYCYPCNMTFRVEAPASKRTERSTCECGRHYWHVVSRRKGEPARVGVWPENVEAGE